MFMMLMEVYSVVSDGFSHPPPPGHPSSHPVSPVDVCIHAGHAALGVALYCKSHLWCFMIVCKDFLTFSYVYYFMSLLSCLSCLNYVSLHYVFDGTSNISESSACCIKYYLHNFPSFN